VVVVSIPVAPRSKARVCGRSLAGIAGSNPAWCTHIYLVNVVCFQVEGSVSVRSLLHRSATECVVSECNREASIILRSWRTGRRCAMEKQLLSYI